MPLFYCAFVFIKKFDFTCSQKQAAIMQILTKYITVYKDLPTLNTYSVNRVTFLIIIKHSFYRFMRSMSVRIVTRNLFQLTSLEGI